MNLKQISALGTAIHSELYATFSNLTILVKYLKDMNRLLKKLNLSTVWLSPSGLIIEQNYSAVNSRELTTSILGKRKSISIKELDKDKMDLRKQNNAIVPNLVHSFDASNISLLVKNLTDDFNPMHKINLLTIHDCFATNANDVDFMILQVKLAFLELYSDESFITSYHNFILDYIKKTGNIIINKTSSDPDNSGKEYVVTDQGTFKIPNQPPFSIDENLKFRVLSSQYFIN